MTKISEIVEIYPGMSNTVNLRHEFFNLEKNRKRMRGYKPIKSHREIFLKIAKSFLPNETKVHLMVGHYGTGKSHLLLMLANYFGNTLEMPELKTFFLNFSKADAAISKQCQNFHGDGRYLVVIPDYEAQEDFSENMLSALEEALKREEVDENIDSIYEEALRVLDKWEISEKEGSDSLHKFSNFKDALEKESGSYKSLTALKKGLEQYEKAALNIFKDIYARLMETTFRYNANNIVDILENIIESASFKKRFKGIVFLYDEFDHTLDNRNRRIDMGIVQQFAELCKNNDNIFFVGSLHKELSAFSNDYSKEDFKTVQERFKTIDMRSDGLEEIVTAIVNVKKESSIFKKEVEPNLPLIHSKIPDIKRLNLFDWLSEDEIKEKIINAVYPLHPLAMACLLKLSTTIGSSNRTLFTFLGGEGIDEDNKHSYKAFINATDILDTDDLLSLYTPDRLVDYFHKEINIDNADLRETIKKSVHAYYSSIKQLKDSSDLFDAVDTLQNKILKLMLIFEIVGLANNENNLFFGANVQLKDQKRMKKVLTQLTQQKVIFYNSTAKVYEFRRGADIDWDSIIKAEQERISDKGEYDIAAEFIDIYKTPAQYKFLEATKYNREKYTDMRLLRIFESAKNFGQKKTDSTEMDYFGYYEAQLLDNKNWKDNYDGIVIYIIAETDDEIRETKKIAKLNSSKYILVVIPENPIPIKDVFLELKAALSVRESDEFNSATEADKARLDESYIGDENQGRVKKYIDERNKYLRGKFSIWYEQGGKIIEDKPNDEQEPVNKLLKQLYEKFNNINKDDINQIHKGLSSKNKLILEEAITHLLKTGNVIDIDTNYGNDRGFIKYLKNVFFDKQLLKKIGDKNKVFSCEIEKDISKYRNVFPALADMLDELRQKDNVNVLQFINKYRIEPYRIGEISLELFVAYTIKYFGDELSYKQNPKYPGEVNIQSFEQVEKIVNNPEPLAVFEKRKLDDIQKDFLRSLYKHLAKETPAVKETPLLKDVVTEMKNWFEKIPKLAQSEAFYRKGDTIVKYLQFMKCLDISDAYNCLFSKFQAVWGHTEDERFNEDIKQKILRDIVEFEKIIDSRVSKEEDKILKEFIKLFQARGNTFADLEEVIKNWFNGLDDNQRDSSAEWHISESKPLIQYLKNTQNLREVIYNSIPASNDYGFGKVETWNTDSIKSYINKVETGLKRIEKNRIIVDMPVIEVQNAEKNERTQTEIHVIYSNKNDLILKIKVPDNAYQVLISHEGKDPKDTSIQTEKVDKETIIKPKKEDQTIKLISLDKEGNYSKEITLRLKAKFVGTVKEDMYGFQINKPESAEEAKLILKDLIHKLLNKKKISKTELAKTLRNIAAEIENEN